jgi:transcriptional regulator with XRE-family HTH domain
MPASSPIDHGELIFRLVETLKERVRNGEKTERGFARLFGISQPHIHKVLKGYSALSIENADWILNCLNLSLLDLFTEAELASHLKKRHAPSEPVAELPFLASPVGPGLPWSSAIDHTRTMAVPCRAIGPHHTAVVVSLAPDPEMGFPADDMNLGALALWDRPHSFCAHGLYIVDRGDDAVVRRIRRGRRHHYLVSDRNVDSPSEWEPIAAADRHTRGEIVWLGKAAFSP